MINQESLYTNIEDSKLIAPVMRGHEIEPDGYWGWSDICEEWIVSETRMDIDCPGDNSTPTYRKDTLESVLPEWCFQFKPWGDNKRLQMMQYTAPELDSENLILYYLFESKKRGQESLNALSSLIELLDEHNLLEG